MLTALTIAWGVSAAVTLILIVYLDLRIHALKQSGDLPTTTRQLWVRNRWLDWTQGIETLLYLYSREFEDVDRHTQRFAPVIRVTLPLTAVLFVAAFFVR